ncbi:Uncharacterised protein [Mycobacterium tuberculosis]|uniref:Uncharacterized protein n=3 Tax=Mycobacterium tuberculosis TaxID=1773 RepID=A0A0T9E439_MYCTX|nr:Uncharacterised protein [Mycobacterium tuberculosis]CFB07204.1 Uncharacterised protein [Mycobacterium tuberculosis]CFE22514.1 Uncharacterised protein [Mycobacterium tuberculosis]CFE46927.1 Uncharacterised protein [Mycobacterium tuberculosis]CFE72846.1 Uncharacterised protein [Mycobacterium tuberculosis]
MAAETTTAASELRKTRSGSPAYHSRPNKMMPIDTVCPRSGWATISASATTAAGTSGISISRSEARSMRRAASRCAPQMANAILASSEGCIEKPATTNQPREPLASLPIPGTSTSTSITMVIAKPEKAMRRMNRTDIRRQT